MASHFNANASTLPQGFSVYQPALGAQLQFFPALGSQELDDMMNALIPGPAPMKEKRASISLNFLEHAQSTGKNFKFYTVYPASTSAAASSPAASSAASFHVSPTHTTGTWDFSRASGSASVSPRSSSTQIPATTSSKASPPSGSTSRSRPVTDFSHLPGMKIMTKDGLDVTNSASRGSKTKEQRDHAHLMRIIKACDSCRRKKVRCDPSHKKRPAASSHSPQHIAKPSKKARGAIQKPSTKTSTNTAPMALPTTDDAFRISQSTFPLQPDFTFTGLESLESLAGADQSLDLWNEFLQYPPLDLDFQDGLFLDLDQYFSSESPSSIFSDSSEKLLTPPSDRTSTTAGTDNGVLEGTEASPQFPYMDPHGSIMSYADFNLYSPGSSIFLDEDVTIPLSSNQHAGLMPVVSDAIDRDGSGNGPGLLAYYPRVAGATLAQGPQPSPSDSTNEAPPGSFASPESSSPVPGDLYGSLRRESVLTNSSSIAVPGLANTESVTLARGIAMGRDPEFTWRNTQNTSPVDGISQTMLSCCDGHDDSPSQMFATARDSSLRLAGNERPRCVVHAPGQTSCTAASDVAIQQSSSNRPIEDADCRGNTLHRHPQIQDSQNQEASSNMRDSGRGGLTILDSQTIPSATEWLLLDSANEVHHQAINGTMLSNPAGHERDHQMAAFQDAANAPTSSLSAPSQAAPSIQGGVATTMARESHPVEALSITTTAQPHQDLIPDAKHDLSMVQSIIALALLAVGALICIPLIQIVAALGATILSAQGSGAFSRCSGSVVGPSSPNLGGLALQWPFGRHSQPQEKKGGPSSRSVRERMALTRTLPLLVSL